MASPASWNNRIRALALGLGLGLTAIIGPCWWSIVRDHHPSCSEYKPDFISLYTGAKLMWADRSALYDLEKQRLVQEPIDPSRGDWVLPYFYPPFLAVILVPLAWLPFSAAFVAMTLVNLVLLISAVKILVRKIELNQQQAKWLILATFCNYGVHYALLEAQTSFIALLLLVLYVTTLNGSAQDRAGIWSGLMCFKPQLALVPLLLLLVRKSWGALGLALVVLAFSALVSLAAVGFDGIERYLALSARAMGGEDYLHIQPERMHNLRALTYFFFAASWRDYIWWGATVAVVALVVIRSWANGGQVISVRQWTSILVAMILVTPHIHDHDLTLLIVPSALFLKWAGDDVPPAAALALIGLGTLSLINTVAYPHLPPLLPLVLLIFLIMEQRRPSYGAARQLVQR
jgi:Glycosyltransferase family 87